MCVMLPSELPFLPLQLKLRSSLKSLWLSATPPLLRNSTTPGLLKKSGSELRSAHRTMGMEDGSEAGEPVAMELEALSAMLFSSDRNIMVWINLTSEYSGPSACGRWPPGSAASPWFLPSENMSLLTSSRTATPMLSLVITRFSMTSEPSELAMATWLNSTVCFWSKNTAQPSTCFRSCSETSLARDFGQKYPSLMMSASQLVISSMMPFFRYSQLRAQEGQ
ncbi:hypothetical protein F7725_013229 [Dissostichus mawsoni]|uniref:Uncharacterized protein n=1 Tax=Dissostichus mawsoni TaxID=36200 RepID=A0A7J5YSR4_DISMA|nr:hypothetical protein F7725_013229 [Dissostichus mawsoni]